MNLEYVSSKTLNFSYITNKSTTVIINNSNFKTKALVFYVDNSIIGVSIANNPIFKKGVLCSLELLYKENLLQLNCKIKKFEDGILYFNMPRKASIIQQRGDLRVGCNIKCDIERLVTGRIKNISAGGCYVDLDSSIKSNFLNTNNFKICFSLNNTDLRLDCSVIELTDKYLRAKFINLNEDNKEFITLYCCCKDAEAYRGNNIIDR